jgi:hypothetical protein
MQHNIRPVVMGRWIQEGTTLLRNDIGKVSVDLREQLLDWRYYGYTRSIPVRSGTRYAIIQQARERVVKMCLPITIAFYSFHHRGISANRLEQRVYLPGDSTQVLNGAIARK